VVENERIGDPVRFFLIFFSSFFCLLLHNEKNNVYLSMSNKQKHEKMENQMEIKSMELYVSPMRERNLDKYGYDSDSCECCGKKLNLDQSKSVHMGTDWMAYNTDDVTIIDGIAYITGTNVETQGFFPIGNDCAKKMNGFTFKFEQ
jgi:hypothetical protein